MATQTYTQEFHDLHKRLEWLDEERRKSNRRLAELEQRLELQEREISTRDQRIQILEQQLTNMRAKVGAIDHVDPKMTQLRKDLVGLIDGVDNRRLDSEREVERVRRVDRQSITREIAEIRKELPLIPRLQNEIDQRKNEEARLSQMIASVQNRFPPIDNRVENLANRITYVEEQTKQSNKQVAQLQTQGLETSKKVEALDPRIESVALNSMRYDATIQELDRAQADVIKKMKGWFEQVRISEYDRNQRVDAWEEAFTTYRDDMAQLHKEWIIISDQAKQTKASLQTMQEWRKQLELQQRESAEISRLEIQRLQARWDDFVAENEKFWKTIEIETQQRANTVERRQKYFDEQLLVANDRIDGLRNDKETMRRVQVAQSDAIKRIPAMWLEEVEKAIANDPNRRRQPTRTPTPED